MADFEELKLTVTLVDDASAGLTNIRTQLTQLTQTAGQVQTAFAGVAGGVQQVGQAAQQARPHVANQEKALKELSRSAEETTRGILQMGLAARRGAEAFPELVLATREAWAGVKGVSVVMGELGAASRLMVVGLGAVVVGIGAIGAAVAAYGISVFKFSREMYTLSQTAKSLGMTFGSLRTVTEQNERFGVSVEATVGQLGRLQEALTDLSENNSRLRHELLGKGLDPNWLNQYTQEKDLITQQNMARERGLAIRDAEIAKGKTLMQATGEMNRFLQSIGQDPGIANRPPVKPLTAEEKAAYAEIERQSQAINEQWVQILEKISKIKEEVLAWGLPAVLETVKLINQGFEAIATIIPKLNILTQGWANTAWSAIKALTLGPTLLIPGVRNWAFPKDGAVPEAAKPEAGPTAPPQGLGHLRRIPPLGFHPTSYEGANDNINPLLHRASFGGDSDTGGSSGEGRAQSIIKSGVFEALVQFYGFLKGGGTGGGGGRPGVVNASYTTGNVFGGGGGGGGGGGYAGGGGGGGGGVNLGGGSGVPGGGGGGGGGGGSRSDTGGPAGGPSVGATGDPAVPSDILDKAKAVALHSGPGGVEAFMRSQGYPKAGNWCGEFAASVVKSAGGTPPQNPAIASNWRNWGTPVEGAPQPGDVAVRKGARTGSTGSHVTFVENYDPKTGTFTGLGGNQGRWESKQNASRYEFRRAGKVDLGKVAESAGVKGAAGGPGTGAVGEGGTGYLAAKRAPFAKELEEHPETRKLLGAVISSENVGAGPAVAESLFNRTELVNEARAKKGLPPLSLKDMMGTRGHSFYGPIKHGYIGEHLAKMNDPAYAAKMNALTDQALGGSDTIKSYTDQGSKGDPNYEAGGVGVNINKERFNDWGYPGSAGWRQRRESEIAAADRAALSKPLDRSALNDNNKIHSTGQLDVNVAAPPGTKVKYHGQNLLKNTSMQRQTQMEPTSRGPSSGDQSMAI
jgi:uncharacterized protein (TIGR02594 family)